MNRFIVYDEFGGAIRSFYTMREALEENHYCNSSEKAINLYNAAISKTPAQSLTEFENEVIEKCANFISNQRNYIPACVFEFAAAIRALKG